MATALTSLGVAIIWILLNSLKRTHGELIYALDDCYIHMAVAKNFSQHGVWGVTPYQFSSSASSLLWPLILSGTYALCGPRVVVPLAVNIICALTIVLFSSNLIAKRTTLQVYCVAFVLAMTLATPLPALIFTGMEHTLHVLLALVFAYLSARLLNGEYKSTSGVSFAWLCLAGSLLTATRYEGLFEVFVMCGLLAFRKRLRQSCVLGLAAFFPVGVYGIISVRMGWPWLPNSVILKGHVLDLSSAAGVLNFVLRAGFRSFRLFIDIGPRATALGLLVLAALAGYAICYRKREDFWEEGPLLTTIFLGTLVLHLVFASVGWFFRYEAYLVALGVLSVATTYARLLPPSLAQVRLTRDQIPRYLAIGLFALIPIVALFGRAALSLAFTPMAMEDRYLEHVCPAKFVAKYYDHETVVANDIGALCFYTNAHVLDIFGLGSLEPLRFRKSPSGYTAEDVYSWTSYNSARIAILQVDWAEISPRIPTQWVQVAEWRMPRNVVFEDTRRIGIFSTGPQGQRELLRNLQSFTPAPGQLKWTLLAKQ